MPGHQDPESDSRRTALIGLGVTLVLVLAGFYLARELGRTSALQDCVMSGRTNCAPIDASQFQTHDPLREDRAQSNSSRAAKAAQADADKIDAALRSRDRKRREASADR